MAETETTEKQVKPEKNPDHKLSLMLATQNARRAFDQYRAHTTGRFAVIFSIGLLLSLIMNLYQATRPVQTRYILANTDGRITTLVALSQPNMRDNDVANWMTTALTQIFSFDFVRYKSQLQDSRQYFTAHGWDTFQTQLQESHLLPIVIDNKYILTIKPTGAPTLISSGSVGGVFAWRYSIPMVLNFSSSNPGDSIRDQSVNVTATITRTPEIVQQSGIGIDDLFIEKKDS